MSVKGLPGQDYSPELASPRGWANYYRHSAASSTFAYVGSYAFKRMELWLRKKTKLRVRAVYKKYYRRNKWLTWAANGENLYHTGMTPIEYKRYAHRPNPYLDPHQGIREWDGTNSLYGESWTEVRDEVRRRDGERCTLCGSQDRVEIHHIRKHKGNTEHNPERMIALCATCHRDARNPQSEVSRRIARLYLRTGKPDEAKVSRPVWEEA